MDENPTGSNATKKKWLMGPNRCGPPRSLTETSVKSGVPPSQVGQRHLFGPMSQHLYSLCLSAFVVSPFPIFRFERSPMSAPGEVEQEFGVPIPGRILP